MFTVSCLPQILAFVLAVKDAGGELVPEGGLFFLGSWHQAENSGIAGSSAISTAEGLISWGWGQCDPGTGISAVKIESQLSCLVTWESR